MYRVKIDGDARLHDAHVVQLRGAPSHLRWRSPRLLAAQGTTSPPIPDQAALEQMTARFAPTDITADVSGLPAGERQALAKLVQAAG